VSHKLLPNGTRQIIDFQIPGDFLGSRSILFRAADYNVEPVTRVEATEVRIDAIDRSPQLATAVRWAASRDEAMVVEHLIALGRRDSRQRTVHFLLELGARLMLVGPGTREGFAYPLSQCLIADALGLSAVHVNRVLRQLREERLLTFREGKVMFDNFDALVEVAGFDMTYLDQMGPAAAAGGLPRLTTHTAVDAIRHRLAIVSPGATPTRSAEAASSSAAQPFRRERGLPHPVP
jgi:CRP-like cAMP-binding protein